MTNDEIKALSLKLAQDARLGAFHLDDGPTVEAIERFARLCIAQGLQAAADRCKRNAAAHHRIERTAEYCAIELRDMAAEMRK
jgi:hypothetical protein